MDFDPYSITIETDVSIIKRAHRGGTPKKAPLLLLERLDVGDSAFVAPPEGWTVAKLRSRFANSCSYLKRRDRREFTVRAVDGGVRVWRLS